MAESALVSSGCRNQVPQAEWLEQLKCPVSQFWSLEVQDPSTGSLFLPRLRAWLIDGHLLSVSSHDLPWRPVCAQISSS